MRVQLPSVPYAAVAQLVERHLAMVNVVGSNPVSRLHADVAQLVEHLVANEKVVGSKPIICLHGVIAQLVEHLICTQDVGSSTLPGSTIQYGKEYPARLNYWNDTGKDQIAVCYCLHAESMIDTTCNKVA